LASKQKHFCSQQCHTKPTPPLPPASSTTHPLEQIRAAERLLNTERATIFPGIILEAEDGSLVTGLGEDISDGSLLVGLAWHSITIAAASAWPTALQVVRSLAASSLDDGELAEDERTGPGGGDGGGEEGLDVGGGNVDDTAEGRGVLLDDVDGFRGGDRAGIASTAPGTLGLGDESSKIRGRAVTVEDSFVTNDNHGNVSPVAGGTPGGDLVDLAPGSTKTLGVDEDTDDDLEAMGLGGSTNVNEAAAVSGIKADGGETVRSDLGKIGIDVRSGLALASGGVRGVGHGPLVATWGDVAIAASWRGSNWCS
jgi:hypothetical protein